MELELSAADKSVAQILKTTVGDICIEGKAISILGDILRSLISRIFILASKSSSAADRQKLNIFDIKLALSQAQSVDAELLQYCSQMIQMGTMPKISEEDYCRKTRSSLLFQQTSTIPTNNHSSNNYSPLPTFSGASSGQTSNPILPPLPQPYTFKRTPVRAPPSTETEAALKLRCQTNHDAESSLYSLLERTSKTHQFINFE